METEKSTLKPSFGSLMVQKDPSSSAPDPTSFQTKSVGSANWIVSFGPEYFTFKIKLKSPF